MELPENERSILAYFPSSTKAEKAMHELQNAGLVPGEGYMQIDRVSQFGVTNDSDYNSPINNAITNHGPTLYSNSEGVDDGANPLLAAMPSASGMAGSNPWTGGAAFLVTLVTESDKVEQALSIIRANDGNA
jgi:hypothetical protein